MSQLVFSGFTLYSFYCQLKNAAPHSSRHLKLQLNYQGLQGVKGASGLNEWGVTLMSARLMSL